MPVVINGSTGISGADGSAGTPAVQGTDTNTGIYFPGADRIGFAEGGVQVGEFDASGNLKFNSGYGSVATAYGCRAWISFNGTGTPAIRGSGNVSSITDNSTGNYNINFSSNMPDTNYSFSGVVRWAAGEPSGIVGMGDDTPQTNYCRVVTVTNNTDAARDYTYVFVAVFR